MSAYNKGLVFIVDISGYSQFIRKIDPIDGMAVISHLLNGITAKNQLSLQISEVEGDAILFYQFGPPPPVQRILQQFSTMLNAFRKILSTYSLQIPHISQLSLKGVVH